jgi:hypothetical protein
MNVQYQGWDGRFDKSMRGKGGGCCTTVQVSREKCRLCNRSGVTRKEREPSTVSMRLGRGEGEGRGRVGIKCGRRGRRRRRGQTSGWRAKRRMGVQGQEDEVKDQPLRAEEVQVKSDMDVGVETTRVRSEG